MKLENQVVSLELSKQLKEAGYKQEGLWWWSIQKPETKKEYPRFKANPRIESYIEKENKFWYRVVAPTVAELGEALPATLLFKTIVTYKTNTEYFCETWPTTKDLGEWADTEANTRCKMLLYLVKEGLVKL